MFRYGIHSYRSENCMRCVVLSKFVKSGSDRRKEAMLNRRATILMVFSFVLLIKRMRAEPTTGRNMSMLSIGKPKVFVIVCSIIYLRSIMATMIRMPVAIMVA